MSAQPSWEYNTMPFGKHQGRALHDIPIGYLQWVLRETSPEEWLDQAIRVELDRRTHRHRHEGPRYRYSVQLPSHVDPAVTEEIVDAGKRALSLRNHPDMGGDLVAMQRINAAADWLRDHLAEIFMSAGVRR